MKTIFNIEAENFDLFFDDQLPKLTPEAKGSLPGDVGFKLFRGGGKVNSNSTSRLGFMAKLYILWKALNKRWWIVIEDENSGMSPGQFMELRKAYKKREYGIENARDLVSSGTFVLANKELCEAFSYLNRLSVSPAYNFLIKGKNKASNSAAEWSKQMQYVCAFLANYEKNKKTWVSGHRIEIPEWLVLLYLYHGKEVVGSPIYKEFYKRAYQSSPTKLRRCFGVLQAKGMIHKTGQLTGARFSITALGIDTVNTILTKYALNV